jgi:hypothetical protein
MERLGRSSLFEGAIALFVHQPWYGFQFLCPACSSLQGKPTWPRSQARALQSQRADGLKQACGDPRQSHNWRCQRKHRPAPRSQGMLHRSHPSRRGAAQLHHRAREDEVVFSIMTRMARRGASIAVVVKGRSRPYASHVTGIISRITSPIPSPKVSDLTQDKGAARTASS